MVSHCRICLDEEGTLIYPCACKGSTGGMHRECLEKWVLESGSEICEICNEPYNKEERCGCNMTLWFNNCCTLKPTSRIESSLMACMAPHFVFGGVMLFVTPIDQYVFVSSMKTLALILSLIMIQLYHSDVPWFVYKVATLWQIIYLVLFCVVGAVRADTMTDTCSDQCYKLSRHYCDEFCPVSQYYIKKTKMIDQSCFLELCTFGVILVVKIMVDCCINMKVVKYYSRNPLLRLPNCSDEEAESLLSSSSASNKGSDSSSLSGDMEV